MASKGRASARLESDIQVARDESNWRKVIELAEQLKTRSPNLELLSVFLIGEGKLELYLLENPPLDTNTQKARNGLSEARKYLTKASCKEAGEAGVSLDAYLLLGKLSYACGNYEDALERFQKADLINLAEKPLPCRSIRIVAESYAIKAFCLEKQAGPQPSDFEHAEEVRSLTDPVERARRLDEVLKEAQKKQEDLTTKCIETATDLTLLYIQEIEEKSSAANNQGATNTLTTGGSYSPQPPSPGRTSGEGWRATGLILQQLLTRIQTSVISNDPSQHITQAKRLRSLLTAIETSATQGVRLFLAKQLAELLLRGHASGPAYKSVEITTKRKTDGAWKPKRYSQPNSFIPNNEHEEIILLLLISEAMAVRNAVLSQSPEFKEQRLRAFETACNVYDQLAVCLARWGQLSLFHECLERGAIKFSFEEPHTWTQYALSLLSMGEHVRALRILEEVYRLCPHSAIPCMLAARACYLHLKDHEQGLKWSKRAIATKEGSPYNTHSSRAHLLLGVGLHLRATALSSQHLQRTRLTTKALDALQKAQQMGPGDHLVHHHLAMVLAHNRRHTDAIASIKQALNLRPDYAPSLHLLGLLLTAQKQHQEALNLVTLALDEWPDSLDLMLLQAHLEQLLSGPEAAKCIAIKMLAKWKVLYEDETATSEMTNQSERRSESRSLFHLSESGSNPAAPHSTRGGMMNGGMSESSFSSLPRKRASGLPWEWLVRIWLLLAEMCLHAGQREQALKCVDEAQLIQPLTPDVLVARGMVCESDGAPSEAKNYYESAISLEPGHLRGLQHLGKVYHTLGKHSMAEFVLMKAAKLHPTEHETWYTLGLALEAQGDHVGSADCMAVALDVENSSPILPFFTVPLSLE